MSSAKKNWSGRVLLWEDHGVFVGSAGDAEFHESPSIKVCVAIGGSFELAEKDGQTRKYSSAIVPAGVGHSIHGGGEMVMLLIAPEGELGQKLLGYSQTNAIVPLDDLHSDLADQLRILASEIAESEADGAITSAVETLQKIQPAAEQTQVDPRVSQSIAWIRAGRESGFLVKEIAAEVDLSESRFSHLFTEFVRVPVRRYLLWLRLRDVLHMLASAETLTEAAHSAGFADSAHLSRTFRNALGIAPTDLVKTSSVTSYL